MYITAVVKMNSNQLPNFKICLLFYFERNEEEMLQLKRRLSERAIHSASSGFLLQAGDQEIYLDNLESFKIDAIGIFLTLFSTSLIAYYYFHEESNYSSRNDGFRICIILILSQLVLISIMPKLYLTYLEQFTLGEGILISHCIILFYYSNITFPS